MVGCLGDSGGVLHICNNVKGKKMTKDEAKREIEKVFSPEYANYIITALTEGATVSDKGTEQQHSDDVMAIHTQGLDEGIRCAMCTNSMANDRGCDGGCVVNDSMYKNVMKVIEDNLVKQEPKTGHWINDSHGHIVCTSCNETNVTIWKSKYCPCCGARMSEVEND